MLKEIANIFQRSEREREKRERENSCYVSKLNMTKRIVAKIQRSPSWVSRVYAIFLTDCNCFKAKRRSGTAIKQSTLRNFNATEMIFRSQSGNRNCESLGGSYDFDYLHCTSGNKLQSIPAPVHQRGNHGDAY